MSLTHQSSEDNFAAELRGFGVIGITAILIILLSGNIILPGMILLPVGAILTLIWVHLSYTPWSEIGYVKPKSWSFTIIIGAFIGIILKFFTKAIVLPLFGADPVNHAYHFLTGNVVILPTAILAMLLAAFAEETVFRGLLFERLGKLLGTGIKAKILILLITSILFALGHLNDQGITGVSQAIITGLVFGAIYIITGNIWMSMTAHAAFDLVALAIIYLNLETKVSHLFF